MFPRAAFQLVAAARISLVLFWHFKPYPNLSDSNLFAFISLKVY